jgi:UDPglucose 6-dehydrogenase
MKVAVFGLWHLGCVTAGCLANLGHDVKCLDYDDGVVSDLQKGILPIYEPGLKEIFEKNKERISYHTNPKDVNDCEFLWIAFDTPVDDNDVADLDFVYSMAESVLEHVNENSKIIISSQVPVGSTEKIENEFRNKYPEKTNVTFAYSPENLRLGNAINIFSNPDRIIMGVAKNEDIKKYSEFINSITTNSIWINTKSAEMVKHSINAFLATCVVFANEMSRVCEENGVDVVEVENGFRSEERIGLKLPLRSGLGFAGGTLARDVKFLSSSEQDVPMLRTLIQSNDLQNEWCSRMIRQIFPDLHDIRVGIIGLAYKNDTNTLRRSVAYNLCKTLEEEAKSVYAFDKHIDRDKNAFAEPLEKILKDCDCIVIFSKHLEQEIFTKPGVFRNKTILDPNGIYSEEFKDIPDCVYMRVGRVEY